MRNCPGSDRTREGHYAKKQLFSRSWLISFTHNRRFVTGLRLARAVAGTRVLDYGCGDGTFLAMLMTTPTHPAGAVGAERNPETVSDCRKRVAGVAGLSFVTIDELGGPEHQGKYDVVFCMEVLEHVVPLDAILDDLSALLTPAGRFLVSVPVEIGPMLVVKQAVRRIAGWRGIGDYPGTTSYTFGETIRAIFAGPSQHVRRPIHQDGVHQFHDHKGFNWKVLRVALERRFTVESLHTSPISWLPPWLGSQVWISCRRR